MEEQLLRCIEILKHELFQLYAARHQPNPREGITRLGNITPKMLGSNADRKLKTKCAETWGVLLWLEHLLSNEERRARTGDEADVLPEASQCLIQIVNVMNACGINMPQEQIEMMLGAWKRFLSLTEDVQECQTPKRHAMAHMILDTGFLGDPRCYANWVGESLNKLLKSSCKKVSQSTFEKMVLLAMAELLSGTSMRGTVDM